LVPTSAHHQDGARPPEADHSQRHGVSGQSDRPVANSQDRCYTQDQQRRSPWYPAHACTHEDKDTALEATSARIKKLGVSWYATPPHRAVRPQPRTPARHFDKSPPLPAPTSSTHQTPSSRADPSEAAADAGKSESVMSVSWLCREVSPRAGVEMQAHVHRPARQSLCPTPRLRSGRCLI
jgi:hypothetical protein